MAISVFKPFIKRRDMDAVLSALLSETEAPGTQLDALLAALGTQFGCTTGLGLREYYRACLLALQSLGLPPGSRLGISVLAPSIWRQAIVDAGLVMVPMDVAPKNPNPPREQISALVQAGEVSGLVIHHALGYLSPRPLDLPLGFPVIEDLSQVFGLGSSESVPGQWGDLIVLAMEDQGMITSGGGAVVFARSGAHATILKSLGTSLHKSSILTDSNAALARTQLIELPSFLERREEIWELLHRSALRSRHHTLVPLGEDEKPLFTFPLLIESGVAEVVSYGRKKNIEILQGFSDSIFHGWDSMEDPRKFPNAQGFLLRCLIFPLHPGLRQKELEILERVLATLP